jgi:hypothetical protein
LPGTVAEATAITATAITASTRSGRCIAQIARPAASLQREARKWNPQHEPALAAGDRLVRSTPLPCPAIGAFTFSNAAPIEHRKIAWAMVPHANRAMPYGT